MPSGPAQPVNDPRLRRLLIGLTWIILRVAILSAPPAAGVVAGHGNGLATATGTLVGIVAAVVVSHRGGHWLMRLRLRHLRATGVEAKAVVVKSDWDMSSACGIAIATYTVLVRWIDPATGVARQGNRRYRFVGLALSASRLPASTAPSSL